MSKPEAAFVWTYICMYCLQETRTVAPNSIQEALALVWPIEELPEDELFAVQPPAKRSIAVRYGPGAGRHQGVAVAARLEDPCLAVLLDGRRERGVEGKSGGRSEGETRG